MEARAGADVQPLAPHEFEKRKATGIQFGLLRSSEASKMSVIGEKEGRVTREKKDGIFKYQDLFDPRLGVPNKEQKCATCGGTKRGGCSKPNACDGHFGHISFPVPIYHPHLVRKCQKTLSSICLACGRVLEKQKRTNALDAIFQDETSRKRLWKSKDGNSASGAGSRKRKRTENGQGLPDFDQLFTQDHQPNLPPDAVKQELGDSYRFDPRDCEMRQARVCKEEPAEMTDPTFVGFMRETPGPPNTNQGPPNTNQPEVHRPSNDTQADVCKYCRRPDGKVGLKLPAVKVKVFVKAVGSRGRIETLKLVVDEKAGVLPSGFWDFVGGHPTSFTDKTRTLLPYEAWKILKRIPAQDIRKLQMDEFVSHPEAFILKQLIVSPNCNRLIMEDWSSTLQPTVIMQGRQNSKLGALVRKVKQIKEIKESGKLEFAEVVEHYEDLQLLAARHLRACKVVDFRMKTGQEVEETGGSLELKWLKSNVLAKRCNLSARTVINGDPCIRIEEIGIPMEIAQRLTVDETVNRLNISIWQKYVQDYMNANQGCMRGAFYLKKRSESVPRDLEVLREKNQGKDQQSVTIKLEPGDTITRCLRDGDYVIANRPPSLHKHSLIALRVKIHPLSTFAINPLICPPFEADFDGDAFHVFVPQSSESIAELKELMSVTNQMICPQGGQPLMGLTQDSLLGGHLLTKSHIFVNYEQMQQLSMWCTSRMPIPAIVKSPKNVGPLWTGKQLFSMTLPDGLNFGSLSWTGKVFGTTVPFGLNSYGPDGEVLILDGEILICQGGAKWLDRSENGIVRAICNHAGPEGTVEHLNSLQALLHQWLLMHGFSIGLLDYHVGLDVHARKRMLEGVQKSLQRAHDASLKQALRLDREVQLRILSPHCHGLSHGVDKEHKGCFGLLLGDGKSSQKVTALQAAAIERFQALAPVIENLITGYMDKDNSLLAMVRSGSKGSMAKLTQQAGCLGLQLYKGESVLPVRGCTKLSYFQISLRREKSDMFNPKTANARQVGFWESRGIIASSYLDGLNPPEFFIDSIASRCNVMRQGIEEPNQILKSLMLFMRDIHIAYDGTVRNRSGQGLLQFRYGGLKECPDGKDTKQVLSGFTSSDSSDLAGHWVDSKMAGEPVGVLAATSIAEPAYNVKMQSIHQAQLLGSGPVQLLKEILMGRAKSKLKMNDRRSILRLHQGFAIERRALEVQKTLEKMTLEMITLTCAIEYMVTPSNRIITNPVNEKVFMRISPWTGHLLLCKNSVQANNLNIHSVVQRLNKKHSGKVTEDLAEVFFEYSDNCSSKMHPQCKGLCIWFYPVVSMEDQGAAARDLHSEKAAPILESMKTIMLPVILNSTIKGLDEIERVRILWEDSGAVSRLPHGSTSLGHPLVYQAKRPDPGELVLEVVIKATKGAGKRGTAWLAVKEACIPVMDLIDWRRSSPYSIQEIHQSYGVEAAHKTIKKRLALATKNMGKPVLEEHVTLVADTMTHCGDVLGMGLAGYREFCRHLSVSTPFTEATYQYPKKAFLDAAISGACEGTDGVLPASVWGTRVPIGTGVDFRIKLSVEDFILCQALYQVPKIKKQALPLDPLQLWDQVRRPANSKTRKQSPLKGLEGSLFKQSMERETAFENVTEVGSKCTLKMTKTLKRTAPPEDDKHTTFKRTLENMENKMDISHEPVIKLHRKHGSPGLSRVEGAATILKVNDPCSVPCSISSLSYVAIEEELGTKSKDQMGDNVILSLQAGIADDPSDMKFIDGETTSGTEKGLAACCIESDKKTVVETTLSSNNKSPWSMLGIKNIFQNMKTAVGTTWFSLPHKNDDGASRDEVGTCDPEISGAILLSTKVFSDNNKQGHQALHTTSPINGNMSLCRLGTVDKVYEQSIIDDKEELQNLLHVRYRIGERLHEDVQKMILEEVLVHHPKKLEKIGCGVDYLKVDYHPEYSTSKCFHIVRKDGSSSDFSYHKCLDSKLLKLSSRQQT